MARGVLVVPARLVRYTKAAAREVHYRLQKSTKFGFDAALENELRGQAVGYLKGSGADVVVPVLQLDSIELTDDRRYEIFRHDIYRRFDPFDGGADYDQFGRTGRWVPRGTTVYYDRLNATFVKVFDAYTATFGEAKYLGPAMRAGLFEFLCPSLEYRIVDADGVLRGYAIREGRPLTRYEFERYVGSALRDVILHETARTGFYFYDLEFHNVIVSGNQISLIDLESILPIAWFGTDTDYARDHLHELDVGWPLQSKWCSPEWYDEFLSAGLQNGRTA